MDSEKGAYVKKEIGIIHSIMLFLLLTPRLFKMLVMFFVHCML